MIVRVTICRRAYCFVLAVLIAGCVGAPQRREEAGPRGPRSQSAGDVFAGTGRRDAKTSLADGDIEHYARISDLRAKLMRDQYMLSLGIPASPESERSVAEQRNVVVGGFIYAVKKESDNDFHLIVGDRYCSVGSCLMTVEISGLPAAVTNPNRAHLTDVRAKFIAHFEGKEPGRSRYTKFDPPIHVTLTGSLFFDVDHEAGVVGPAGLKPDTAWEIHPLSDIAFEP